MNSVNKMHPSRQVLLLAVFACLGLLGCKKEEVYVAPDSSYGLIYDQIFAKSCALSGCHASGQKKKDPDGIYPILEGEAAYATLINGASQDSRATNAGLKLVTPNDPATSFLYQKIAYDSSAFQFGAKMPIGGLTLTANQIKFVRQWISAGAPISGHVADRSLMQ
jgi:hypothetical protein